MAALGNPAPDASGPQQETYLWPDNLPAWQHWQGVRTQWRVGNAGATGLDYASVRAYLHMQDLSPPDMRDIFVCIQAAECATLEVWAEKHNAKAQQ